MTVRRSDLAADAAHYGAPMRDTLRDYDESLLPDECPHSPDFEPRWCTDCMAAARSKPIPPSAYADEVPPVITAAFETECHGCGMTVHPGQRITKDGERWVHLGC